MDQPLGSKATDPPILRVTVPACRVPERRYVLDVVLDEWLAVSYRLELSDRRDIEITMDGDSQTRRLLLPDVLLSTPEPNWLTDQSMPRPPLAVVRPREVDGETGRAYGSIPETLPVLFGGREPDGLPWRETRDGLTFSIDIFGSIFFLLTRYEEIARPVVDQYGRYCAPSSIASTGGILDLPLADEYTDLLWRAMHSLWPSLARSTSVFQLCMTHDVDLAWSAYGRTPRSIVHAVAGDILSRHDAAFAYRRVRAAVDARSGRVERDPFNTYDFLMDVSEMHGVKSTFYFMARGGPSEFGAGYSLTDRPTRAVLRRIHARGHAIALHASYASHLSVDRLRAEFDTLQATCDTIAANALVRGVRQHFLRFKAPETWRAQEAVGLEYDSTLGFVDEIGFRAGTCREFSVFDVVERRHLTLRERPLLIMDRTLFDYMSLDAEQALSRAAGIVEQCRQHGGRAVILYHNSFVSGPRRAGHYRQLLATLTSAQRQG